MTWNYRILAHKNVDNDEVYLQIHEVYYDQDNNPISYTENPITVGGEDINSIKWSLNKMQEAINKPILSVDNFPQICKVKYKCELCGRNNFDRKSPHNCKGGFRKRNIVWSEIYV